MSKDVDWNREYGTGGEVYVECDQCGKSIRRKFKDNHPYKKAQEAMKEKGWIARKVMEDGEERWHDFCCDKCFDEYRNGEEHVPDGAENLDDDQLPF